MHDIEQPDHAKLFETASSWRGYFTAADARAAGFSRFLLRHHVRSGRITRIRRGLYRFRDYPSMPHDEVMEALLTVSPKHAVVSHESALDLLELSDIIPDAIHLTVPRSKRYVSAPPNVQIHTRTRPFDKREVIIRQGIRLTSATQSILDSLEYGSPLDQIERAIYEAIERGLTNPQRLEEAAALRNRAAKEFVDEVLIQVKS